MKLIQLAVGVLLVSSFLSCSAGADKARLAAAEAAYHRGDFKPAADAFQAMAKQSNARAQFFLGEMYLNGSGVPRDYALALKWASAAAEQKDPDAQYTLGGMYESGKGVAPDDVLAHMWYSLSASSGDEQAIRRKAELEIRKMSGAQIERSKQLELAWLDAHKR